MSGTQAFGQWDEPLAIFIESLPGPVIIIGPELRVIAANGLATKILPGLRMHEPLVLALRAPEVLDCVRRVIRSHITEKAVWFERFPVERMFEINVAALTLQSQPAADVVMTFADLTEAHRIERMRTDFVANASHELRTPLSSLLGFIETLQGAARDDPAARGKFLVIMRQQAKRMARLVDDLLSLSRIEQNAHITPSEAVNLTNVVLHIGATLAPLAHERGVVIEMMPAGPVVVTGDQDELARIAENLIENAIKYSARSDASSVSKVVVSLVSTQQNAILSVRDFGCGIAPEHLPRLTERFYRIDAGDSKAKGGTGLGLAIVKHIVARHRGQLSIASELGAGSEFIVSIPLQK